MTRGRDTGLLLWRLTRPHGGEAPSKAVLGLEPTFTSSCLGLLALRQVL